mmetsp:Transcript_49125/g.122032  ORF Transcript_49125/g.122032 Transcript_49125/m.122032 type:complete len:270 (+) Transcript_49125:198-1007(+)
MERGSNIYVFLFSLCPWLVCCNTCLYKEQAQQGMLHDHTAPMPQSVSPHEESIAKLCQEHKRAARNTMSRCCKQAHQPTRARAESSQRIPACLQFNDLLDRKTLERDLVDTLEERELVRDALGPKDGHDVLARDGALQLLPIELGSLDFIPSAFLPSEGLGALAIAAAKARGDKIGEAAALHESVVLDAREKHLGELGGFLQTDTDDGRLRVPTQLQPVAEAGPQGNDVLERAAEFDASDVVDASDAERGAVEHCLERVTVGLDLVSDC